MNKKLYVAESRTFKTYGHSPAEARQKQDEFGRNPLMNTPYNRLGDPTYQTPDRSNVSEMTSIREATEQEMRDAEEEPEEPEDD